MDNWITSQTPIGSDQYEAIQELKKTFPKLKFTSDYYEQYPVLEYEFPGMYDRIVLAISPLEYEDGEYDSGSIDHHKKFVNALSNAKYLNDGLIKYCIELRLSYCWGGNEGDEEDTTWAVLDIESFVLPEYFDNGEKIPKRFKQEIEKEIKKWNKNCPI